MVSLFFVLFIGLELKHYIADYFMQPGWILAGKGNLRHPGGYAHAGIHAGLTGLVLLVAQTPVEMLLLIVLGEFLVHYLLDFSKIQYSRGVHMDTHPGRFWSLHGLDQILHQLTYGAIIYLVLLSKGMI